MAVEADVRFLRRILGLLVAATVVTGLAAGFASVRAANEPQMSAYGTLLPR